MMNKNKDFLILAIKGTLYIYLPVMFLLYIIYGLILKTDMIYSCHRIIMYAVIIGISAIRNYAPITMEQDVKSFSNLKSSIIQGRLLRKIKINLL